MNEPQQQFEFLFAQQLIDEFLSRLMKAGRVTVSGETVWRVFSEIYRPVPDGFQGRECLMTLLNELSSRGDIALPVHTSKLWDRTSSIPTPRKIKIPRKTINQAASSWREFPWHPQLQWVLNRKQLSASQFEFMKRVQAALVDGSFDSLATVKYRSLQLTGDEKCLIAMSKTQLFGEGKLSFEMLGCDPEILPMVIEQVSQRTAILIFENAAPFMIARRILRRMSNSLVGYVAYGSGHQVSKSVDYLRLFTPAITEIFYVGDLDRRGIYIAAKLQRTSISQSLPTVTPATSIHQQMLKSASGLGAPDGWPDLSRHASEAGDWIFNFLHSRARERVKNIVNQGNRIPEEVIDDKAMRESLTKLTNCQ